MLINTFNPRQEVGSYLPDSFQGLSERAFGSALKLLEALTTAALLLHLRWARGHLLTHLHKCRDRQVMDRDTLCYKNTGWVGTSLSRQDLV